jgi:lipopolysaccharide export system protein LptA
MLRIGIEIILVAALTVGAGISDSGPAAADKNQPDKAKAGHEQIQITADQLVSHSKESYAEFIGNVEAVQGDFEMRADRLRIYYRLGANPTQKSSGSGEPIDRIVASGNVKIKSDNRSAETEQAEYRVNDGILILKGKKSIVTDGQNLIQGTTITLNRNDGRITVEGNKKNRVRAVFHSTGNMSLSSGDDKADKKPEK